MAAELIGLGVGPGDEVLVPTHTYMATATVALYVGAIPIIVDIDESLTISPASIRETIGPNTSLRAKRIVQSKPVKPPL